MAINCIIYNFQKGQSLCLPSCCIAGSNTISWCFTKYLWLQSFSDNLNCFCQYSSHKTHLAFFGGENGTDILISVGTTPCLFKNVTSVFVPLSTSSYYFCLSWQLLLWKLGHWEALGLMTLSFLTRFKHLVVIKTKKPSTKCTQLYSGVE